MSQSSKQKLVTRFSEVPGGYVPISDVVNTHVERSFLYGLTQRDLLPSIKLMRSPKDTRGPVFIDQGWRDLVAGLALTGRLPKDVGGAGRRAVLIRLGVLKEDEPVAAPEMPREATVASVDHTAELIELQRRTVEQLEVNNALMQKLLGVWTASAAV